MKGLRLYLAPFAPDDSGAAAVLYPLGGLVVICDAGGCAGNICGFDEPRWGLGSHNSAVFSAGLRDMDAIMGRDDKLLEKMAKACADITVPFAAIIGTPVPAVIGTDYHALARLGQKRLGMPVITIPTTGTHLYDTGISMAYLALLKTFAVTHHKENTARILGVWGVTPLDLPELTGTALRQALAAEPYDIIRLYGIDADLNAYRQAGDNTLNLVYSPAGLAAAQWLQAKYDTPYQCRCPLTTDMSDRLQQVPATAQKLLIIHQQYQANACRAVLQKQMPQAQITCATWFMQEPAQAQPQDLHFQEEDDFITAIQTQHFDVILGDSAFRRALPKDIQVEFIAMPHFAVSGEQPPASN